MNIKAYYEDPKVLHVNTEPNRAYYIPKTAEGVERATSLSGEWSFDYYESVWDLADDFEKKPMVTGKTIPVPSVWQNYGYDRHMYVNIDYPFPYDPPYVPSQNPCGVYRRSFKAEADGQRRYLYFEGVDSCCYVYVNGKFVGYSQVSHSPSEFDITDHTVEGENELTVLVLKWCDGSYLEDQDKFRMSGIFRDVLLITRPTVHIRDFTVTTKLTGRGAVADVKAETTARAEILATLYAPDGKIEGVKNFEGRASFEIASPKLWNAEEPVQYTLRLVCGGELIEQPVGIREIKIEDGVLYLNNKAIKFHGVNRHDSDPVTGSAISREQAIRDLELMKKHNVNAIRTSHYPNAPWFPELCSKYGFYMIAETDIESHGCVSRYGTRYPGNFSQVAEEPMFREAIVDRVQRNVIRDKNCAAVLIWSMGNEAGYSDAFCEAARWTHACDPTRLVHYEGVIHAKPEYTDFSMFDLYSQMYASMDDIENYFSEKRTKPYVLCEYTHSMGNSCGDCADYQEKIDKYPGFCGAFVWEWCQHAIYVGKTNDGRAKYYYGGDFGEKPNDGNFCVDGLVRPDRTVTTNLMEFKNVVRPVRFALEDGKIIVRNFYNFTRLSDRVYFEYELTCGGVKYAEGRFAAPELDAGMSAEVKLDIEMPESGVVCLNITTRQLIDLPFVEKDSVIGHDQLILRDEETDIPALRGGDVTVEEKGRVFEIKGGNFTYTFDKILGSMSKMVKNNRSYLEKPVEYNIWRAFTDNDCGVPSPVPSFRDSKFRTEWHKAGYDRVMTRVYSAAAEVVDGVAVVTVTFSLAAVSLQRVLTAKAVWRVDGDGAVTVEIEADRDVTMPYLPRFGLRFFLPKEMENLTYMGYGPTESYNDKHHAAWLGRFETAVANTYEDYLRPQEHGSHFDTRYAEIEGGYMKLRAEGRFSFSASHYTQEQLAAARHNFELEKSPWTVLCVDSKQSGVGSTSCGPVLLEKYRLDEAHIEFKVRFEVE